jgi:hypothetical protein
MKRLIDMEEPQNKKMSMKEPQKTKIYAKPRAFLSLPIAVRRTLEARGWMKNGGKDDVWIAIADGFDCFLVYHTFEDFLKHREHIPKYYKKIDRLNNKAKKK